MDLKGLKKKLSQKTIDSLFLIVGEDSYLSGEALRLIKQRFENSESLDSEVYFGDQLDEASCLDSMNTLPLFSSLKLITIRKAEKLRNDFLKELFSKFVDRQDEDLFLILHFSKIDKRKKIIKDFLKKVEPVEVQSPYENQLPQWISYIAEQKSLKLSSEVARQLSFMMGANLSEIEEALEKISLSYGSSELTKEKVFEFVAQNKNIDVFKICDLLVEGDLSQADRALVQAFKNGEQPLAFLNLFFRHFKILKTILATQAEGKRIGNKDLAAKVGVPSFFLKNYQRQAAGWNLQKIDQVFTLLEKVDLGLKSMGLHKEATFSALIVEISRIYGERKGLRTYSEAILF